MKKLMCLMVALLVAPAMATVTISVVDKGDLTADIVAVSDGADLNGAGESLVAGIGLDLSVDVGNIVEVTNFMATGESVDGAEGYGIFMGTILFTGDPVDGIDLANVDYSPVAPADAPDLPGTLPGPECTLEFGCLFNVNTPEAAPLATTTLCTVEVSEEATLTLALDDARGGSVLIGGGAPSSVVLESALVTDGDCYIGPDLAEWIAVGKPDSWCNPQQCHGDADGVQEDLGFNQWTWVGSGDVAALIGAYRASFGTTNENLATDFDHVQEDLGFNQFTRTGSGDVSILIQYYRNLAVPGDCNQ